MTVPSLLPVDAAEVDLVAKFFRALSDPTRLRLLELLLTGEHTLTDCVAHVERPRAGVTSHLACLAACAYVAVRREGRLAYYRGAHPRLADLVKLAHAMAADNAAEVSARIRIT